MAGAFRRVARLGVRLNGLHDLHAGLATGVARTPAPPWRRRRQRRGHWLVRRNHLLHFFDRLGHRRSGLRGFRRSFWPGQNARGDDPDLCAVHRAGGVFAHLVAIGAVPVHHGAGHRRRMGGGRGAGRRSVAGEQTHPGRGPVAIRVGSRVSPGGHPQFAPAAPRMAAHVHRRRRAGGRGLLRLPLGP